MEKEMGMQGPPLAARGQRERVQKVQRVQRVWWRLTPQNKRGAPDGAGCIEGLCSLRSRGDSGFAAEGKVVASPQFIAPFHRQKSCRGFLSRALV